LGVSNRRWIIAGAITVLTAIFAGGAQDVSPLDLFTQKRYAEAKERATEGATRGDAASMYVLGEIYTAGAGVTRDDAEASRWFHKAADAGFARAMNALGSAYEGGQGVEQNFVMAAAWYKRSAETGDAEGMTNLGRLYESGGGVARDYPQALQWYEKGANAGDANGMYHLALSYETGKGTAANRQLAAEWFRKAAAAGSEQARARIGNNNAGLRAIASNAPPVQAPPPANEHRDKPVTDAASNRPAACLPAPPGMAGWWPGDGDAKDRLGGSNPTTVNKVSFEPGEVSAGFRFANSGYIAIPESFALENQRFTLSAWVRADGPGPQNDRNGSVILNQPLNGHNFIQLSWSAASQRFVFSFGEEITEFAVSRNLFPAGKFHHVAGTYDGNIFRLFVDGSEQAAMSEAKKMSYSATGWRIGGNPSSNSSSRTWNGIIDEVQLYDRALSVSELGSIFQAGSAGLCKSAASSAREQRTEGVPAVPTPGPALAAPAPAPSSAATAAPGRIRTMVNAKDGQIYIWIPPGTFTMGCSNGDTECGAEEKPPHTEQVESGFWMGRTEVTQGAFRSVMGNNPSAHQGDRLPVESVTWNEALDYCTNIGGRLPTDGEWEYAARAGTTSALYGEFDAIAWNANNGGGATHPVAQKQPNAFGLYDMLGNVWEWVEDSYPGSTTDRILRGGSLFVTAPNLRASRRASGPMTARFNGRGFRCAGQWSAQPEPAAVRTATVAPPSPPKPAPPTISRSAPGTPNAEGVYTIGGDVSKPVLVRQVEPDYSEKARQAKLEGVVVLYFVIGADGRARDFRVMKSLGSGLDEKAIEAVSKWRFDPSRKAGKPVPVASTAEINFRLM
jgi:TonB family protein